MTGIADIFVGLLLTVAVLAMLARKLHIPYPILFVIGGLLLGWIPELPKVMLNPELVFLFFLPPLLFPAALFTSWRDFRANLRPISLLAIGLVLFTTKHRQLKNRHSSHSSNRLNIYAAKQRIDISVCYALSTRRIHSSLISSMDSVEAAAFKFP
jgi:hypothetical protein